MPRLFPQFFYSHNLEGPRAKHFQSQEDAFQQLLGDALKETTGYHAHVLPTKGNDGSIDAYIKDGADLPAPFHDLPLPLILETKYHDQNVKDLRKNIFTSWRKVRSTLERAAQNGWTGLFQPWNDAHGYAYCVSAFLPNEEMRRELTNAVRNFFFVELPLTQRPPIEVVRIIDWNDLRGWLSTLPCVSDSWLGIELDLIVDHETYLKQLGGFRKYLLPSNLQFVLPDDRQPFHPERVMEQIEESLEKSGVLLVGAGGVGKTRTCLEVATKAVRRGWRVLHVLPGEPGIDNQQLAEEILRTGDKTLLVFDYIDQMHKLDLSALRRTLIPKADARALRLRLLANARPGWARSSNPGRDELFSITELQPTHSQKFEITQEMVHRIAPSACKLLGQREVTRLCGHRAIIALLIAKELETLAETGNLPGIKANSVRPGDLVAWLNRRLEENALSLEKRPTSLLPALPSNEMIAAAAALVCAPGTKEELIQASKCAFQFLNCERSREYSQSVVNGLIKHGWLELQGSNYSAAHDVVADEVFDQTIRWEEIVFEKEFNAILACTLEIPQAIGPLAKSLGRLVGAIKGEAVGRVEEFAIKWLTLHAASLGEALSNGSPATTGYAIGALFSGPPWEAVALRHWDDLVSPWLSAYAFTEDARHVLYRGLQNTQPHQAKLVIESALRWLEQYSPSFGSGHVIGRLLERRDLTAEEAERARGFAIHWLDEQVSTLETRFVLTALLNCGADLVGHQSENARQHAFQWLREHCESLEAQFVVRALLQRDDLSMIELQQANQFAHAWLGEFGNLLDAQYVLNALLGRKDLSTDDSERTRASAFQWLEGHSNQPKIRFVLQPLLDRVDLSPEQSGKAKHLAFLRLLNAHTVLEAQYLLRPLLDRTDLLTDELQKCASLAFEWLREHSDKPEANSILRRLLQLTALPPKQVLRAKEIALRWLTQHCGISGAQFVLTALFKRTDLANSEIEAATGCAFRWFENHGRDLQAQNVFNSMIGNAGLRNSKLGKVVEFSDAWMGAHHLTSDLRFILEPLLRRSKDLEPYYSQRAKQFALQWLEVYGESLEAQYVLKALLDLKGLTINEATTVIDSAAKWLFRHRQVLDAGFVFPSLLGRRELAGNQSRETVEQAMRWLEIFYDTTDAEFVMKELLRRRDLSNASAAVLLPVAINMIRARMAHEDATHLLRSCLEFRAKERAISLRILSLAREWLELHPASPDGDYVWNPILRDRDRIVCDADWQSVSKHAFRWLEDKTIFTKQIDYPINSILSRPHLIPQKELEKLTLFAIEVLTVVEGEDRRRLIKNLERLMLSLTLDDRIQKRIRAAI